MADIQETRKQGLKKPASTQAFRDLLALLVVTVLVLVVSYFFDAFVIIVRLLQKHPQKVVYVDEVVMGLLTLAIGLAVFAWRRWLELKKETTERIAKQEELLRLAATQAEIERIISKQLRSDMDQLKQDVREMLYLFHDKHKRTV